MQIVDMHCDTISRLFGPGEPDESLRENSKHVDLLRMKEAGYLLQNFAIFVNKQEYPDTKERALSLSEYFRTQMERNADMIAPVTCMADIENNRLQGKMSAMLTLEEGAILEGSVDILKSFYDQGVRMITLTWNYQNEIGFPHNYNGRIRSAAGVRCGLTKRGFEMAEAMEALGIIIDVSHLSDDGFNDVLCHTAKPFVASHSNSRAICNMSRNLSDDMIRGIAGRGGVIGLNFYPPFLGDDGSIAAVIRHAKHIINVGGTQVLGLGSDFDGIDGQKELLGAETMPKLIDAFLKEGFTYSDTEKIFGSNVLRVYRDIIG